MRVKATAFELKRKETVPDGIRRVVCERVEKALVALDGSEKEMLKPLAAQHRCDLQNEARELGLKLYAESDDEFIDRIHGYWEAWR